MNYLKKNLKKLMLNFKSLRQKTPQIFFKLKKKISIIDRAQQNISGLTENVIDLKNILSNSSKRGRFGEVILENLISDHLPTKSYEFQKTLSNHTRVDCIIKSSGSLNNLCIDAKFPRESFEKVLKSTSKDEKNKVLKMFKSDIMNHVMDVKTKYIIPGETSEIALIFIPSEQIYVEIFNLIPEMTEQFYDFKIFLVSPTTLWIVLSYIESILRDKKISENSKFIFHQLKDLTNEVSRLETRIKKMDSHFSNAQSDLNDILVTTKKIKNKKDKLIKLDIKT